MTGNRGIDTVGALLLAMAVTVPAQAGESAANEFVPSEPATKAAVITVSKAGDALGAPIELRPLHGPKPAIAGTISRPDRLPLRSASLTSRFGMRNHPISGGYRPHSGIDLAAPAGSPVLAPAAGVVSFANWRGGYGLLVVLDHGGGMQTRFGHLSRLMVSPGQRLAPGDLVGLVGSSGRATGPHLHYELRSNGLAIDPLARR